MQKLGHPASCFEKEKYSMTYRNPQVLLPRKILSETYFPTCSNNIIYNFLSNSAFEWSNGRRSARNARSIPPATIVLAACVYFQLGQPHQCSWSVQNFGLLVSAKIPALHNGSVKRKYFGLCFAGSWTTASRCWAMSRPKSTRSSWSRHSRIPTPHRAGQRQKRLVPWATSCCKVSCCRTCVLAPAVSPPSKSLASNFVSTRNFSFPRFPKYHCCRYLDSNENTLIRFFLIIYAKSNEEKLLFAVNKIFKIKLLFIQLCHLYNKFCLRHLEHVNLGFRGKHWQKAKQK